MLLRATKRIKDGKEHRYCSVVEKVRHPGSKHPVQKPILYLGELNDSQQAAWSKALLVCAAATQQTPPLRLFPEDRTSPPDPIPAVQVCWQHYEVRHPRHFGDCWLATELWRQLGLDTLWTEKLGRPREGTDWAKTLLVAAAYRLIAPGSEWQCWRLWDERRALGDLLGPDFHLGNKDQLYAVLDRMLPQRAALFQPLRARWQDRFGIKYEVLLSDLTSTYFEGACEEIPKATYGYSRDHRPDCKQVVLALVVTPAGLPRAYEVMPGHTQDKQTLKDFIARLETLHGKADRIWIMDRGIPTEEHLAALRARDPPGRYLVGTPRPRVKATRAQWENLPWQKVPGTGEGKRFREDNELYVVAKSDGRRQKEIAIRRKKLARFLWTLRGMRRAPKGRSVRPLRASPAPRRRPACEPGNVPVFRAPGETGRSRTLRRPLSFAQQPDRAGTGVAVEALHAAGGDRRRVPRLQERSACATGLPPGGSAGGSAHLRELPGVLPVGDAQTTVESAGPRPDPAPGVGRAGWRADARRGDAHDRRAATDPEPAHATRDERATAVATTQTGVAGATSAAPGLSRKTGTARRRM